MLSCYFRHSKDKPIQLLNPILTVDRPNIRICRSRSIIYKESWSEPTILGNTVGNPWVFQTKPIPLPTETHTHTYGYGFLWVWVWVFMGWWVSVGMGMGFMGWWAIVWIITRTSTKVYSKNIVSIIIKWFII